MSNGKTEEMLAQLIKMVGAIQSDLTEVKTEQQEMKADIRSINHRIDHLEIEMIKGFNSLKVDQDYIWEKTARNEREINQLKKQ